MARVVGMITDTRGIPTSHIYAYFTHRNVLMELRSVYDVGIDQHLLYLHVNILPLLFKSPIFGISLPSLLSSAIFVILAHNYQVPN